MTTTLCDMEDKKIVADNRWSCGTQNELLLSDGKKYFVYCDYTGFEKISVVGQSALIVAGNGLLISDWKRWWVSGATIEKKPETTIDGQNAVCIAIIDMANNKLLFDAGPNQFLLCLKSNDVKGFSSGSGGVHAASQLVRMGNAEVAVIYASELDICTSENLSIVCYKTNTNNLKKHIDDYKIIADSILNEGKVMEFMNAKPADVGIDIAKHPLSKEIEEAFKSGSAVANAPVPGIGTFNWTKDTDRLLEEALEKVHELQKM